MVEEHQTYAQSGHHRLAFSLAAAAGEVLVLAQQEQVSKLGELPYERTCLHRPMVVVP